ncbi:MAG: PKD domain-containing protein [Bacteroidota bacterium]|nr:PKD domain-containing protein [Bacteroidota bacterium]
MKKLLLSICFPVFLFLNIISAQTVLIDYNFNNYDGTTGSVPAGWTLSWNTSTSFYTSTASSGPSGPNSYKFGINNVTVTTPQFLNADTVSFWLRGLGVDTISTLYVTETINGTDWDTIATIPSIPTTGEIVKYKVNFNSIQLKFHYVKSVGNLAFDDFQLIQVQQVTADFDSQNICIGESAEFTDLSTTAGNSNITDWLWDFGNSLTSTDQNPSHIYNTAGTYNVKLVVTDNLSNKDSITQQFSVYERPAASFGQSSNIICLNEGLVLTNSSVSPTDGTINNWSWEFNDGSGLNTSDWDPTHYFLITGTLEIKLILYSSNIGCSDTALSSVVVNDTPLSNFSYSANQQVVTYDGTNSLGTSLIYDWDFGDGTFAAGVTQSHTYPNGGAYNACLTVTDDNGCEDTMCEQVNILITGIKTNETKKMIAVYPNPSVNGILTVDFSKYAASSATITVNNIIGSEVWRKEISALALKKQLVDLSDQPNGSYFLNIKTNNEIITKKIILNKR